MQGVQCMLTANKDPPSWILFELVHASFQTVNPPDDFEGEYYHTVGELVKRFKFELEIEVGMDKHPKIPTTPLSVADNRKSYALVESLVAAGANTDVTAGPRRIPIFELGMHVGWNGYQVLCKALVATAAAGQMTQNVGELLYTKLGPITAFSKFESDGLQQLGGVAKRGYVPQATCFGILHQMQSHMTALLLPKEPKRLIHGKNVLHLAAQVSGHQVQ
jgi:hypothetical protein